MNGIPEETEKLSKFVNNADPYIILPF